MRCGTARKSILYTVCLHVLSKTWLFYGWMWSSLTHSHLPTLRFFWKESGEVLPRVRVLVFWKRKGCEKTQIVLVVLEDVYKQKKTMKYYFVILLKVKLDLPSWSPSWGSGAWSLDSEVMAGGSAGAGATGGPSAEGSDGALAGGTASVGVSTAAFAGALAGEHYKNIIKCSLIATLKCFGLKYVKVIKSK